MGIQTKKMLTKSVIGSLLFLASLPGHALTLNEVAKLLASDGAAGDGFGYSVSIDGDSAVIGAIDGNVATQIGAAYVFVRDGAGNWSEQAILTASDGAAGAMVAMVRAPIFLVFRYRFMATLQ